MKGFKRSIKRIAPRRLWIFLAVVYRRFQSVPYRLDMLAAPKKMRYYCPCCKLKFRRFTEGDFFDKPDFYNLNAFSHVRQDLKCPFCDSLPRHRILAHWCEKNKDLFKSKRILYFAPEKSMIIWLYNSFFDCTCADLDGETDLKLDIQNINLQDGSYDIVICNHVLEHVDDFRRAVDEVYRVLSPGGFFICSFPMDAGVDLVFEDPNVNTDEERKLKYGQSDHVRMFGRNSHLLLAESGFDVSIIDGTDCPEDILPEIGPSEYDMNRLFICKKN